MSTVYIHRRSWELSTVANILANRYNKSYDATSNKRYSLSDQTAKIVKGLAQPANDHLLRQDHQLPSSPRTCSTATRAYLPRYTLDYVDPDKSPQVGSRRRHHEVRHDRSYRVGAPSKNKPRPRPRKRSPALVIRDLKSTARTVCFVIRQRRTPDRRHGPDSGYSGLKDALGKDRYQVKTISLLEKA
jgi:hypothetical protein